MIGPLPGVIMLWWSWACARTEKDNEQGLAVIGKKFICVWLHDQIQNQFLTDYINFFKKNYINFLKNEFGQTNRNVREFFF